MLPLLVAAILVAPLTARADGAPTGDEIKKVLDYYNNGKDSGPVLAELKPCLTVDQKKGSTTIYECTEPVSGKVKKGTTVNAWMNWLVPKDGKYEDLSVQWIHNGTVRTTQDLALKTPLIGSRTWLASTVQKEGKWEIKILRDGKELGSAKFEVE
jgi:hypothetical protein